MPPNEYLHHGMVDEVIARLGREEDRTAYAIAVEKLGPGDVSHALEITEKKMGGEISERKRKYFMGILKNKARQKGLLLYH